MSWGTAVGGMMGTAMTTGIASKTIKSLRKKKKAKRRKKK